MTPHKLAVHAGTAVTLPVLLTAAFVQQTVPDAGLTKTIEDIESVDGVKANLKTENKTIVDDDIITYLRDTYAPLQAGNDERVDEWLKRAVHFKKADFKAVDKPLKELDAHLTLRSYIVGYAPTLADFVIWGILRGNKITAANIKRSDNSVSRWYSFIESSNPWMSSVYAELNAAAQKKKAAASAAGGSYNIGLQNTENGVVTRFPPEPSGYLHIGHAKAALLNDFFAHEYVKNGTLICRFDDTNPSKENQEFEDSIKYDLLLLGIIPDKTSYSSDYFQEMYDQCVRMIKAGNAYADDTEKEKMQAERFEGQASARRNLRPEESLARLEEMKSGSAEGQRWCIRAKISVDDVNKALRDPVIYRVNLEPHHRTGSTWKIYPTYDFCVPIVDSLEGVTHALRTTEYGDRNAQYKWMQAALGLRPVNIWEFARMNFVRTVLSKRKLTNFVNDGVVWGWDDPRMPTIRGIRRRGMSVEALREFILKQGPSRNVVNLDWTSFWTANKRVIDGKAARYTAVDTTTGGGAVPATVTGVAGVEAAERPCHAKNAQLGTKTVVTGPEILMDQADAASLAPDEEVTLMNWGNAIVRQIEVDDAGAGQDQKVSRLTFELHLAGDVKKTAKKLTWLTAPPAQKLTPVSLVDFDYLITKDKIEKDEELADFLTPQTEFRTAAVADCNVARLKKGDVIQFDRKGFFIVDRTYGEAGEGEPAVLFNIPTGKTG